MLTFWEKHWSLISSSLLYLINLYAVMKSYPLIQRFPKRTYIKPIVVYFVLTLAQSLVTTFEKYIMDPENKLTERISPSYVSGFIYINIEYYICSYLLSKFIKSKLIKKILRLSLIFMLSLAVFLWFTNLNMIKVISIFSTAESILLLLPSFYYFYEILYDPPVLQLNKEPSFWIVTGIIFLFICLLPVYLGLGILNRIDSIQTIDYIGYALIILLFLKGISCKATQSELGFS